MQASETSLIAFEDRTALVAHPPHSLAWRLVDVLQRKSNVLVTMISAQCVTFAGSLVPFLRH